MYPNGGELWDALQQWKGAPDLREHVALIITDLEMPQMDGHRLTKLIKCDPEFSRIRGDLLLPDHGGDAPEGKRGGRG